MSRNPRTDPEPLRLRMMAALDGELLPEEVADLERRLTAEPELRHEWDRLRRVRELTARLALANPPAEAFDVYRANVLNRLERSVGWTLCLLGAGGVGAWGLVSGVSFVAHSARLPWTLKLTVFALVAGALWLVLSVLREKWCTSRGDPYKQVRR